MEASGIWVGAILPAKPFPIVKRGGAPDSTQADNLSVLLVVQIAISAISTTHSPLFCEDLYASFTASSILFLVEVTGVTE